MNYYERHLGDYAKDAGHLSMLEHGAYTLLLDRYYTTEQAIPADQAHRVCRARSREERAAVDAVLAEFFLLADGVWKNGRADREIEKMRAKVKAAKENGKLGGRPKQTDKKPSGFPLGPESETQAKAHQTPVTIHQSPEEGAKAPSRAGALCRLLREHGIQKTSPGHPLLLKLLDAGCTEAEFLAFVPSAATKSDPFAYLLAAVKGERERAAVIPLHQGRMPNKQEALEQRNAAIGQEWARKMLARGKDEAG
ncbi:MAG: YdaU family protein [Acetobacteraceae bacterium]